MNENSKTTWLATPTAHWSIVVAVALAGAAWLHLSGAQFVRNNPLGYVLSPFLVLGMLVAELTGTAATYGLRRPTCGLALSIGVLSMLYAANQVFVMPITSDIPMLTYLIFRRRFLTPRTTPWRIPELWLAILMLAAVIYIKIMFLPRPVHMIAGCLVGLLLFASSRWWQGKTTNGKRKDIAQQSHPETTSKTAPSAVSEASDA